MHIRLLICDGCQRPMRLHLTPGERLPAIAAKIGWYVGGSTTLCPDCFAAALWQRSFARTKEKLEQLATEAIVEVADAETHST